MRLSNRDDAAREFDQMMERFFGRDLASRWTVGSYEVPTDVFQMEDRLVIRMDLPDIDPDAVDVTVQENTLLINGQRRFPYDSEEIRFVRRGTFYGDFTQRVALAKGLDTDKIEAHYRNGVLELTIPYGPEIQPKRIAIKSGDKAELSG